MVALCGEDKLLNNADGQEEPYHDALEAATTLKPAPWIKPRPAIQEAQIWLEQGILTPLDALGFFWILSGTHPEPGETGAEHGPYIKHQLMYPTAGCGSDPSGMR